MREFEEKKLEIIKLETRFEKCQRDIKNRDNYGDGLHLIDFEKLKIENQSLNEKIEQRNEDIFKLKKKSNLNVIMLAHLEEKL